MEMVQVKRDIQDTYGKLKNAVSWGVDKRFLISIASYYVITGRTFDAKRFIEISDEIKAQTKLLSPLRSHIHHSMVAFLDSTDEMPGTAVGQLIAREEILKQVGFKRSMYSYLAALFINGDVISEDEQGVRGKELYDAIRKHHPFLTSHEDIPFAVLLSKQEGDIQERATTMNDYFKDLKGNHFYSSDELQWTSQIMTITNASYNRQLVENVLYVRDYFKKAGIKVKRTHYMVIGLLGAICAKDELLQQIVDVYYDLEQMNLFKWGYKEMILPIAVQLETKQLIETQTGTTMTVLTSIESILQAQQAAMISTAVIVSASTAANSNGGN
ncbi:DUF4003 family protein [Viridibacillus sp. FSL R5-0477]|uniref:DUF4003 domain-containing protein n=1 Tax=Viridibacillus arenosi FSL R5-213 TaxID=1227360 RepID=W4F8N6_9BACL|nr:MULTISPECIES: DUF4003 family protein [Viridibacillus]ETT88624.1 hypothetical protein C176_01160 [Viridibacillus arenosi FSL R5-213]OMC81176.1 hypothetical protein BK130_15875 [Viridibacillus sp. FSL H8-0123]OMC85071.1 hypothetical protein BK128_15295 [Viridibacillus sp. FSL H7-0596]OMC90238.1 hypothetical protein BK137_13920 [Viridibacillus arenosi]